jgi:hypothetical protein
MNTQAKLNKTLFHAGFETLLLELQHVKLPWEGTPPGWHAAAAIADAARSKDQAVNVLWNGPKDAIPAVPRNDASDGIGNADRQALHVGRETLDHDAIPGDIASVVIKGGHESLRVRSDNSRPIFDDLQVWLRGKLNLVSQKSKLAEAIRYALSRWQGLALFVDDGRIDIDCNTAAARTARRSPYSSRHANSAASSRTPISPTS